MKVGHHGRRVLGQRGAASSGIRPRRRRQLELRLLGSRDRSGRVRSGEPDRLLSDRRHPRRRLRPSRIRVRRRSGQPFVRQLSVELGVVARQLGSPGLHRRHPANSEGQGLAGYINQVIRTGTYPGFADGQLGIGTPTFYHRAMVEAGGATPDRLFSYYVGVAGYNQAFNYVDNQNGASYDNWVGAPMASRDVGYAPTINYAYAARHDQYSHGPVQLRCAVGDLGARHRRELALRHPASERRRPRRRADAVGQRVAPQQLLQHDQRHHVDRRVAADATTRRAMCANDIGLGVAGVHRQRELQLPRQRRQDVLGSAVSTAQRKCVRTYYFPSSTESHRRPFQPIPKRGDTIWNNQEIVKLQYTKNFGSSAFLRVYGYTYYSDWLQNGPQTTYADFAGCCSPDYELSSHTRGGSSSSKIRSTRRTS